MPSTILVALRLLLDAYTEARKLGATAWEFAVELEALTSSGVSGTDLRCLIRQGLVEHRHECTRRGSRVRRFTMPRGARLEPGSCFVLRPAGAQAARRMIRRNAGPALNGVSHLHKADGRPLWDADRRELRHGGLVVKRFRQPAKNQEAVLAAFQEDGWPARIDNPLAGTDETEGVKRLHDAVRKLNQQPQRLLRFSSDGRGEGVLWEWES